MATRKHIWLVIRVIAGYVLFSVVLNLYFINNKHDLDTVINPYSLIKTNTSYVTDGKQRTNYAIIPNFLPRVAVSANSNDAEIVLCTHTSIYNLHHIKRLSETWSGLISLAVHISDVDDTEDALAYITLLRTCHGDVRLKVSFHLVFSSTKNPSEIRPTFGTASDCGDLTEWDKLFAENGTHYSDYPVNVLRKISTKYTDSPFVFAVDIDLELFKWLHKDMEGFLENHVALRDEQIAYVIPSFEVVNEFVSGPKKALVSSEQEGHVRPLDFDTCFECQFPTGYKKWLSMRYHMEMDIAYFVRYKRYYEPYFVVKRNYLPPADDTAETRQESRRFIQVCEAYMSGMRFAVMNNAFIFRRGFRDRSDEDERGLSDARVLSDTFMNSIRTKYSHSNRRC